MITAQQNNSANGAAFEGNIVVFENRPFSIDNGVVAGETVVEGVFGASSNVWPQGGPGYGAGADRTVLLRWFASQPDPVVKVGDFIADVTYERSQNLVYTRFSSVQRPLVGVPNPLNKGEWDNLPAQRCFWYQVQKVNPAQSDPALGAALPVHDRVRQPAARREDAARRQRQPRGPERRADLPVRRQRDPADVFREVRGVVARNSGEWRVSSGE